MPALKSYLPGLQTRLKNTLLYRFYKKITSLHLLTTAELELLSDPWYHDFETLGFKTPFREILVTYRRNQQCKQGPLFDLINRAVQICKTKGEAIKGLELFCADGFYGNFALKCKADSIYGIDHDSTEINKANLMSRLLGTAHKAKFEQGDVFKFRGEYDFCICAGGLYHIPNPADLLALLRERIKTVLVIQTVYSLENTAPDYFIAPIPWIGYGSNFSYGYMLKMVTEAGWEIIEQYNNELANVGLWDKGSAYLLCVPAARG